MLKSGLNDRNQSLFIPDTFEMNGTASLLKLTDRHHHKGFDLQRMKLKTKDKPKIPPNKHNKRFSYSSLTPNKVVKESFMPKIRKKKKDGKNITNLRNTLREARREINYKIKITKKSRPQIESGEVNINQYINFEVKEEKLQSISSVQSINESLPKIAVVGK